jgi:hypothetical protein
VKSIRISIPRKMKLDDLANFIYPIILFVFPVVHLFQLNLYSVRWYDFIFSLLANITFGIVVLFCLSLITKSRLRSAIVSSIFILLFYSYGHAFTFLKEAFIHDKLVAPLIRHRLFLLLFAVINASILYLFGYKIKRENRLRVFNDFFKVLAVVLCAILSADALKMIFTSSKLNFENSAILRGNNYAGAPYQTSDSNNYDIYYITIDEFAPPRVIRAIYGRNEDWLDSFFVKNGFFVDNNALSNYSNTIFSLSSSLNMNYTHNDLRMLDSTRVAAYFRKNHYTVINRIPSQSVLDKMVSMAMNDFNEVLFHQTVLMVIYPFLQYAQIRTIFKNIPRLVHEPSPKFVHIHLATPHIPFLFDSLGNMNKLENLENWTDPKYYFYQWIFDAKQIALIADSLIKETQGRSIIIFQSDHGVRGLNPYPLGYYQMCFNIFFAIYLPDRNYESFSGSFVPVNLFRIVLSRYFGDTLKSLERKMYFSPRKLSGFVDISDSASRPLPR